MTNRHQLMALQKQKRMERATILLNRMKDGTNAGKIFFSDEKILSVEVHLNSQNDKSLAKSADNIPSSINFIYRRQKPASAMVWATISENWRFTFIFVKEGTKLNTNLYIEDILTPAHVEMKKHFKDDLSHSNRTVRPLTLQTKPRTGVRVTFQLSGGKNCGLLHYLT